jgi:hypothetical protein
MKKSQPIDYFAKPSSKEESVIRRIKGNFRREFVMRGILDGGLDSVPPAWLEHDVSSFLKDFLTSQHPRARGGEDLPDLEEGQVEIARLSLTNSVHAEVTSLRAKQDGDGIALSMVDEYGTEIELAESRIIKPPSDRGIISIFRNAEPSPMNTDCEFEFQSFFHKKLASMGAKKQEGGE